MSTRGSAQTRPVLFIDTNALHFARIFIGLAKQHALPPFGMSPTVGSVDDILKRHIKAENTRKSVLTGRKVVDYLCKQTANGGDILYSPASQFELTYGQLRGRAIENAAAERIPYRMWSRLEETEISGHLTALNYRQVEREVGNLEAVFQEAGIQLGTLDPARTAPVWALTRLIMQHVFLDLGDCTVYAHALLAEADSVLTNDGYFCTTVAGIENPGSAAGGPDPQSHLRRAKKELTTFLAGEIGIPRSKVRLPKALKAGTL